MLTLYTHNTPNGYKVTIALEELGLDYHVERVNVHEGEQFAPDFAAKNANSKIPVLSDSATGVTIGESNAILLYLAEKTGKLLPEGASERAKAIELLFFQAAHIGPMFGQRAHFSLYALETLPYAINRYEAEGARLQQVLDRMLGAEWFLPTYSIVDIAVFGWLHTSVSMGFDLAETPRLAAFHRRMLARPAVQKGIAIPDVLPSFAPRKTLEAVQ
ncbi:MAG: glutathione S-transferase N-terminal domain-containing protein [Pseudomonadota bacterium]